MPLVKLGNLLRTGELSAMEIVLSFWDRIELTNSTLNAYIPYACKDVFLTCNLKTTAGSEVLARWWA